jgi:hypothetical protein
MTHRSITQPAIAVGLWAAFAITVAHGQVFITGGTAVFSTDSNGNAAGGQYWGTEPQVWEYKLFFKNGTGDAFLNGPSAPNLTPLIQLQPGQNSFILAGNPGGDQPYFGMDIYLNNSSTPDLSVIAPLKTDATTPAFQANGGATVFANSANQTYEPRVGAGTLATVIGGFDVTLTQFYWATPSVFNSDQVSPFSTGPDGESDYFGLITLEVTPVPEPRIWAAATTALLASFAFARRRSAKAASNIAISSFVKRFVSL